MFGAKSSAKPLQHTHGLENMLVSAVLPSPTFRTPTTATPESWSERERERERERAGGMEGGSEGGQREIERAQERVLRPLMEF